MINIRSSIYKSSPKATIYLFTSQYNRKRCPLVARHDPISPAIAPRPPKPAALHSQRTLSTDEEVISSPDLGYNQGYEHLLEDGGQYGTDYYSLAKERIKQNKQVAMFSHPRSFDIGGLTLKQEEKGTEVKRGIIIRC